MRDPLTHDQLMRYLDGELPAEEARRVEEAAATSTELRRELAIYEAMKKDLKELSFAVEVPGSVWDQVNRRITRRLGWLFFWTGAVLWTLYGIWVFAASPQSAWEKLAIGTLAIGFAFLLGSTIWERYRESSHDPYRNIQR